MLSPGCVARRPQPPVAIAVTVDPESVQTVSVVELNTTPNPELTVAFSPTLEPTIMPPGFENVIVWEWPATLKFWFTGVAEA